MEYALFILLLIAVSCISFLLLLAFWPPPSLKGCHVVIVGGSSGIGLELADLILAEKCHVSIISRSQIRLADSKARLTAGSASDADLFTYSADVSSPGETEKAMGAAVERFGPISVLICSQGISIPRRFEEAPIEEMELVMKTNYWGSVNAIRAALPKFEKKKEIPKRIILVSSQAGQVGVYGYVTYSASKFALRGLAEALQQELLPRGILLGLLFPPDTDTPGFQEENKTKPEVTKVLSASSSLLSPRHVALASLPQIKRGRFLISVSLEGWALKIVSAGMSPPSSLLEGVSEVLLMGAMRVVAFFIQWDWRRTILSCHRRSEMSSAKTE